MERERKKMIPKIEYERLEQKYLFNLEKILETLNKVEKIEPRFGKPYLKMEISPMELAMLKRLFNDQRRRSAPQAD